MVKTLESELRAGVEGVVSDGQKDEFRRLCE